MKRKGFAVHSGPAMVALKLGIHHHDAEGRCRHHASHGSQGYAGILSINGRVLWFFHTPQSSYNSFIYNKQ